MSITVEALVAPSKDTLEQWLNTPRLAKCGVLFTPSEPMWNPDKAYSLKVNWHSAIVCVPFYWQPWLHAALAYLMAELAQSSLRILVSVLSRAAQAGLDPLNKDHLIDLRERFNSNEFSSLLNFMVFWHTCESLELRPLLNLIDAYRDLPRKKASNSDPILSLDPEKGPLTQKEQNALHQWLHEQFCHKNLDAEQYLFVRLFMVYGQRSVQFRMIVFDDFIECEQGYKIRLFWAKQKDNDGGFREKSETFNLDKDLYKIISAYKAIVLTRLKQEYPNRADWDKAIKNVPVFRRKLLDKNDFSNQNSLPVLVDILDHKALEEAPHAMCHIPEGSTRHWLKCMEDMPGFPISERTHQTLKISRAHRFRYTLGTDLSNAGYDEWTIARALMHKDTQSVRKYRQVSAELMAMIDDKMSDSLALVINAFNGTIIKDRASAKNGNREERQIEDLAVCGADAICHLDAPFSCYACSKFQPLLDADHNSALERMTRFREQIIDIDKTTGVILDRAILACRKVIIECNRQRGFSCAENTHE